MTPFVVYKFGGVVSLEKRAHYTLVINKTRGTVMSSWSTDCIIFGRMQDIGARTAFNETQLEILSRIAFIKSECSNWGATNISLLGAFSVYLQGNGRGGAPIPFTQESWSWLESGVIIHEGIDALGEWFRTITINAVIVDSQKERDMPPSSRNLEDGPGPPDFVNYVGSTPSEEQYFLAVWQDLANKRKVDISIFEAELIKIKLAKAEKIIKTA